MTRFAMTPLTPAVAQKIEALFAPESREAAGRMIAERCGADLPLSTHMGPDPSGFDRIRFAVLKLSHGDLERLSREIDGAHFDWRDTLMAAGFGEDIHAHLEPLMTKSQEHGSLGEYDVVRVARLDAPSRDFSGTDGVSRPPRIGDEAIICHLYDSRDPKAPVAVEMVDSEGRTVWFADFLPDELELVSHTPQ